MRQVINYPVWYSKDRIPVEACEEIVRQGQELEIKKANIYGAETSKKLDNKYRNSKVGWFPKGHELETLLKSYVGLANLETGWNFTVTNMEPIQFGEYKTKHFYDWHRDININPGVPHRKLSVSVNLSNPKDYEGGNLEFKDYWGNEVLKPVNQMRLQGTIIVFPSALFHRVTPVKRGRRYSLVQWYSGPDFT